MIIVEELKIQFENMPWMNILNVQITNTWFKLIFMKIVEAMYFLYSF